MNTTRLVGLFGTCGNSQWRTPFIEMFEKNGTPFFNPVVPNWDPSCAAIEAEHLDNDDIILFPITDETTGFGSLAELGYAISQVLLSGKSRTVVAYIAPNVNEAIQTADQAQAKESKKARALSLAHLVKLHDKSERIYLVDSLEEMLNVVQFVFNND
jgi:hypothetical protein